MKKLLIALMMLPICLVAQNIYKYGVDTTQRVPVGLNVGDKAPTFEMKTIEGKAVSLKSLTKDKDLVILFYRGQWCPVCERYLSGINDSLDLIKEKANVLVVTPELQENAGKMSDALDHVYDIVADTSFHLLNGFDLVFTVTEKYQKKINTFLKDDIAENNGKEIAQLPVPATYVIGKDGVIKYRHFDYNYKVRATAKDILKGLE